MERFVQRTHQLTFIANSIPIHLNYLDTHERFVFVNNAAAEFWGLPPQEMIGKTIQELMGEANYPMVKVYIEQVLQGKNVSHEAPFTGPDGKIEYFINNYIPDLDPSGKVIGFISTGTNITEAKLAHEEAEERAREFKILADTMPQIVWTANPDGHVDYYNQRWYDFTGLPQNSADNKLWDQVLHPEDKAGLDEQWAESLRTGKPYEHEFRLKNKKTGQYHWILSRARPVKDSHGQVLKWYGSNTDIHEQKLNMQNLLQEQNLREKIIATLTHDLRTPLTAAKISSQLISRKNNDPAIQKLAFRIEDNMDRADRMIQDLLDASQVKAGMELPIRPSDCDFCQVTKHVVEELSLIHGNRFVLTAPSELRGQWDCDGLRRILENLMSNAIKYGDQTSKIEVKLRKEDENAILEVKNFGNPIESNNLMSLFDSFKRLKTSGDIKGWGIGLSLVKGLVQSHRGSISVTSSQQSGTCFKVTLPRTGQSAEKPPAPN